MKIEPNPLSARGRTNKRIVDAGHTADLHADDGMNNGQRLRGHGDITRERKPPCSQVIHEI
jgi:hypothetical protein